MSKNKPKVSTWVKSLQEDYFNVRGETPQTLATWKYDYFNVYRTLPQGRLLTESLLREVILKTQPNTKNRRRVTLACSVLADHAGIEHSLRRLIGRYSSSKVNPRSIPDDETILKVGLAIPNEAWRRCYGLMATYGLRNCECFLSDLSDLPVLRVGKAKKSDQREVYPLYPEWVDTFGLKYGDYPQVTGKWNGDLGARVTRAFARYQIPFRAYDLRHAWARRSLEFGMDLTVASDMMGHSVRVHSEIYHHWLSGDVYRKAYEKLITAPDRPQAPRVGR
ncbi:MAG: hypothetical protein ACK5CA_00090 [Cyanobacteriota bacterium]|jgi:integrase